jgi:hypothetical protein
MSITYLARLDFNRMWLVLLGSLHKALIDIHALVVVIHNFGALGRFGDAIAFGAALFHYSN